MGCFSKGSCQPRDWTCISCLLCISRQILYHCATWEAHGTLNCGSLGGNSEKAMAPHSSVLAWRIPGMGEPGGLLSMGSHRVGHNWSDLAAAAGVNYSFCFASFLFLIVKDFSKSVFYPTQYFEFIRIFQGLLFIFTDSLFTESREWRRNPSCHVFFFFILMNYTLKGLLVASSHTIKLCRSFHIKKKTQIPAVNPTRKKILNLSSLLITNQNGNEGCWKQYRKCIKECKNSMGGRK